jgi:hypothetical protein
MTQPAAQPAADPQAALFALDGLAAVLARAADLGLAASVILADLGGSSISLVLRPWPDVPRATTLFGAVGVPFPTCRTGHDPGTVRVTGYPPILAGIQLAITAQR